MASARPRKAPEKDSPSATEDRNACAATGLFHCEVRTGDCPAAWAMPGRAAQTPPDRERDRLRQLQLFRDRLFSQRAAVGLHCLAGWRRRTESACRFTTGRSCATRRSSFWAAAHRTGSSVCLRSRRCVRADGTSLFIMPVSAVCAGENALFVSLISVFGGQLIVKLHLGLSSVRVQIVSSVLEPETVTYSD